MEESGPANRDIEFDKSDYKQYYETAWRIFEEKKS